MITLLTEVIYFLSDQDNLVDPLDVKVHSPNREKQKLIREQDILKQVNTLDNNLIKTFLTVIYYKFLSVT